MPDHYNSSDCDLGTNLAGQCLVVINSPFTGTFTANATFTTTIEGVTIVRSTAGNSGPTGSPPATKTYAEADIDVEKLVTVDGATWYDADDPTGPEADVGSDVTFRFVVTNTGELTLTNVSLTDTDFDLSGCSVVDPLVPGASFTCDHGPVSAEAGQHANTATASGDYEDETYSDTDDAHYFGAQREYAFDKFINGEDADTFAEAVQVEFQEPLTFTYRLTNTGNVDLVWETLDDNVFGELTDQCGLSTTVAPGASASCTYFTNAGDFQTGQVNTGTVTVEGLEPKSDPAWYQTEPPPAPAFVGIVVTKTVEPTQVEPLVPFTYTIEVKNTSDEDAFSPVVLTDTLPTADFHYVAGTAKVGGVPYEPDTVASPTLIWNDLVWNQADGLTPGESITVTFAVTVPTGLEGEYINSVVATGHYTEEEEPETISDEDDAPVTIEPTAVTLLYFRARRMDTAIRLEWSTVAEFNTAGYTIYRSDSNDFAEAGRVGYIDAKGPGSFYQYTDGDVEVGKRYWYWLVDVARDGTETRSTPVSTQLFGSTFDVYLPFVGRGR
jgi:uncharacterized repeat protein (TIGR01451 family)